MRLLLLSGLLSAAAACSLTGQFYAISDSGYSAAYYVDAEQVSGTEVNFKCSKESTNGCDGWKSATCVETIKPISANILQCSFTAADAVTGVDTVKNATGEIEYNCYEIKWDTAGLHGEWRHHTAPSPPMSCGTFVKNVSCPACTAGCDGNPKACVACAYNLHQGSSGYQPVSSSCPDGLAQLRKACGAEVGRKTTPVITTGDGDIQGFVDTDSMHSEFRGIPYAAAPVGDLRWRPPQPAKKWEGVLNATKFGYTCPQFGPQWVSIGGVAEAQEDCLFLNVYAPTATLPKSGGDGGGGGGGLPVMVYFPAGQFMWGSGNDGENFNAPQTAAGEQVILVTMNYRLGALGFLALDELRARDSEGNSTGNYGVQDQRAALKWVKENAAAFGGDPDKIVLWGESAGAAAVTAHLAMEKSWPYFSRAVMESGAFQKWSYRTWHDSNSNALSFASHVNCTTTTTDPADGTVTTSADVACLMKLTPAELINFGDDGNGVANARYRYNRDGSKTVYQNYSLPYMDSIDKSLWSATIDGVELLASPADRLAQGKVADVPMLFGTNRDEGSTFTGNQTGTGDGAQTYQSFYYMWLYSVEQFQNSSRHHGGGTPSFAYGVVQFQQDFLAWAGQMFGDATAQALLPLYTPGKVAKGDAVAAPSDWWWSISAVIGDYVLTCPARRAARQLTKIGRDVFVYYFSHTPVESVNSWPTSLFGAFHGSEVPFVFYDDFELVGDEQPLSKNMVQYWANFAHNGNPNTPIPSQSPAVPLPEWVKYNKTTDSYIVFGEDPLYPAGAPAGKKANITIITDLKTEKCDFWDSFAQNHN